MVDHHTKGVVFRNKNYGTQEFYGFEELQLKTFDQIALDLWDRHRRKDSGFRSDVEASERGAPRQSVKFSWIPPSATGHQPINGARGVLEFVYDTGAREILYFFEPIGGVTNVEAFKSHGQHIVSQPRVFGVWNWSVVQDSTLQIEKVIMDRYKRNVHVFIQLTPRYPETPPRVVTKPPLHDQCFSATTGELGWARAVETRQLIWSEHSTSANPLAELIDELRRKYHVF